MNGLNKYQQYLVEAAYKNSVKNKPNTSSLLSWYEENGDLKKRVDFSSIWLDADYIPLEAPVLENGQDFKITLNNSKISVLRYYQNAPLYKLEGTNNSFKNDLLIDSIESSYGTGYAVRLFDAFGDEIPFGLNKWVADPGSGIVTFIDGIPEGYTQPYFVTFYKYVGRRGSDGIITSDGKTTMLPGYQPTEDKSLVTKDYVDSNVTDVSAIVKKLIPNTPDTFEGRDLELVSKHRPGSLITSTDPEVNVVYVESGDVVLRVPEFWNEDGKGFFSIYVNNNEIYRNKLQNLTEGFSDKYVNVESVVESYPNELVADDFYKSLNLTVTLDYVYHISPYIPNPNYPIFQVKVKWDSNADTDGYFSNSIIIGLDRYSREGFIPETTIIEPHISHKYISGVPAMVEGDSFKIYNKINTLKRFKKAVHGHVTIDNFLDEEIYTELTYPEFNSLMTDTKEIVVQSGLYMEDMHVTVDSLNLDNEVNCNVDYTWNIRTDSVSDESNRVTSPDENNSNFGKTWDITQQMTNLKDSNELQMLNGLYQWPRGNYRGNGTELPFADAWGSGPDYTTIPKDGIRYVTFKFNLEHANGFYFMIDNANGFEYNPYDFTFKNIASIKCFIDDRKEWLDMNIPFDGVLSPFDFEDKGCLVVNRSNATKRYCTFGTEVISGIMYITLGINYDLDIKLSGISVSVDN